MRRPAIRDDLALSPGYHSPQLDVDVRLNTNEAPEPPPAAFEAAVAKAMSAIDWHRYPDRGARALRDALGAHHGVGADQVFVANGSNEVLQALCLAYGGPGRRVATFEPTYALHAHIARITNTGVASGRRNADFSLDLAEVARVTEEADPAITFLCSPNNPTGMVESEDNVRAVAEAAPGLVLVDEAYGQFAPWSALAMVDADAPIAVSRTFSKTWSMAAARLGYLIGPTWMVEELFEVTLPYHLDAVKQAAGLAALSFEPEMQARVATLVNERGRVSAALVDLGVTVWPSAANFILFRPDTVDGATVWQRLVDRSVLVRNTATWPSLEGCLRVTLGTRNENDRFLDALRQALDAD